MDADFIVSLKHIPSLWVEEDPRDIERQFNRHIALIERSLSVVPRLDNNDFGSLETTRRAIYTDLSITFNALRQLEKSHQTAKEKALHYWLDAESVNENPESKNKVEKAISSFYENRHNLITMFRIKIAETMVKYFDEQIKPNSNSLYLIRKTLPESNPWRRRIEGRFMSTLKNQYSVPEYAMALILKDIVINKKGIGVTDGVDYIAKFAIKGRATLYNNWNELLKDKKLQRRHCTKAQEIIEKSIL